MAIILNNRCKIKTKCNKKVNFNNHNNKLIQLLITIYLTFNNSNQMNSKNNNKIIYKITNKYKIYSILRIKVKINNSKIKSLINKIFHIQNNNN